MWARLILFSAFAVPVSYIDLREQRIPDIVTITAALTIIAELLLFESESILASTVGAILCPALLFLLRKATNGLGMGDVKFSIVIGLACAPILAFIALIFASVLALCVTIPLLTLKKINNKTKIPFGPFLCLGTILSLTIGALKILD